MLNNSLTIIISKKNILLLDKKQTNLKLPTKKSQKSLVKIAETLKKLIKSKNIIILLAENISYTFCLKITEKPNTENLIDILEKQVPEKLDENSFTWKLIEKNKEDYLVQVFIISQEALELISELQEQNIKINFIQSLSYTLTQLNKNKEKVFLISDKKPKIQTLALSYKGAALYSTLTSDEDLQTDIKSATSVLKNLKLLDKEDKNKISINKLNLDVNKSPALKIKNNLQLMQVKSASQQTNNSNWFKKHLILLLALVSVSLVLVVVIFLKLANYF